MPIPYNPTSVSGKVVAKENESKVLRALHLFGHLRRSELAHFVWPNSSEASAKIMCSTTTKRMLDSKLLLERPNSLGGRSLVLTSAGVAALSLEGIESDAGYDLTSVTGPQFWHRTLGTCFLIHKAAQGLSVLGEHALGKEKDDLSRLNLIRKFEKAPDGIVLRHDSKGGYWVDWVEVESSAKEAVEIFKMFNILNYAFGKHFDSDNTLKIGKLYIVYDTRQPHERTLGQALNKYLHDNESRINLHFIDNIVFVRCDIDFPLVIRGFDEAEPRNIFNIPY